ncbi:hypothetical protein [Nocardia jiangsuensis]|uniref:Uncharacterized protein n=1 Tax=Nocardia jiangsuensis TaxID=1691563 RepID=A0ABV8DLB4_9NOCA
MAGPRTESAYAASPITPHRETGVLEARLEVVLGQPFTPSRRRSPPRASASGARRR